MASRHDDFEVVVLATDGCRVVPVTEVLDARGRTVFELADINVDGVLDVDEIASLRNGRRFAMRMLRALDLNGDGLVDPLEWTQYVRRQLLTNGSKGWRVVDVLLAVYRRQIREYWRPGSVATAPPAARHMSLPCATADAVRSTARALCTLGGRVVRVARDHLKHHVRMPAWCGLDFHVLLLPPQALPSDRTRALFEGAGGQIRFGVHVGIDLDARALREVVCAAQRLPVGSVRTYKDELDVFLPCGLGLQFRPAQKDVADVNGSDVLLQTLSRLRA